VRRNGSNEHFAMQDTLFLTSQVQQQHPTKPFILADGGDPNQDSPTTSCTSDLAGPDAEDLELTRDTSDMNSSMGVDSCHLEIQSDLPEHETEIVLEDDGGVANVASVDTEDDDMDYIDDTDSRIERLYSDESSDNDNSSHEVDDSAYSDSENGESDFTSMTGDSDTESPAYITNSLLMQGLRLAGNIVGRGTLYRKSSETTEDEEEEENGEDEDEEEEEDEGEEEEEEGEETTLLVSQSESVTSRGSLNDESASNRSSYSFSSHSSDGSESGTFYSSSIR
jgi:hypothetical protein